MKIIMLKTAFNTFFHMCKKRRILMTPPKQF